MFNNGFQPLRDVESGASVGCSLETKFLHAGQMFNTFCGDHALASGGTHSLCFKTTSNNFYHILIEASSTSESYVEFKEGVSWNPSTGTNVMIWNHNRNSTRLSSLQEDKTTGTFAATNTIIKDPTGITGGTTIDFHALGSTAKIGSTEIDHHIWILRDNTAYELKFTNESNQAVHSEMKLSWFEGNK